MEIEVHASRRILGISSAIVYAWLVTGCAWRSTTADHYWGPVLFRSSAPPRGQAFVNQVMRIGVAGEAGTTWGLMAGVAERTTVAPEVIGVGHSSGAARTTKLMPQPLLAGSDPASLEDWHFSPFYLRVDRPQNVFFVSRTAYGAELVAGDEAVALSVGVASRTLFTPPDNSISQIHFEPSHPLHARARLWREIRTTDDLPTHLREELMP